MIVKKCQTDTLAQNFYKKRQKIQNNPKKILTNFCGYAKLYLYAVAVKPGRLGVFYYICETVIIL